MKKIILPFSLICVLAFLACGKAAEDREQMHSRAKVFQDSIANALRIAMAEAEVPANTAPQVDTAAQRINAKSSQTLNK